MFMRKWFQDQAADYNLVSSYLSEDLMKNRDLCDRVAIILKSDLLKNMDGDAILDYLSHFLAEYKRNPQGSSLRIYPSLNQSVSGPQTQQEISRRQDLARIGNGSLFSLPEEKKASLYDSETPVPPPSPAIRRQVFTFGKK